MNKKKEKKGLNAFGRKDDINLPTKQEQNIVIEILTLGQPFLICVFPIILLI